MTDSLAATRWDAEYLTGRYKGEAPVPFVNTIIKKLGQAGQEQSGLYVGCGNGRNYIPLLDAGLKLHGIDISSQAIRQLKSTCAPARKHASVGDFVSYKGRGSLDYLIAIQVFQHGDRETIHKLFGKSCQVLRPGGYLFLRVNSVSTEIAHNYHTIEGDDRQGKTIVYESGPKKDMKVHFYSRQELAGLASAYGFESIVEPYEVVEHRLAPDTGSWTQWETIWRKKGNS